MGIIATVKNKIKNFLTDPTVLGKEKNTFDFFVDEVGRLRKKISDPISKFTASPKNATATEKIAYSVDPLLGTGAVGKATGRVLRKAAEKGLSKIARQQILNAGEKVFQPIKKTIGRLGIPAKTVASNKLQEFLRWEDEFIKGEAKQRNNVIYKDANTKTNPQNIVKIRQRGNGQIKITQGELDIMKEMPDLKPSVLDYYFQNPIRMFEQLGEKPKELFYRPIKVAEGLAIKSKKFWNNEFARVIKNLDQKASTRIMKYALSQEEDGLRILAENKLKVEALSEAELKAYRFMRWRYNDLLGKLNEARAVVGKKPIPKRKNYFTHIQDLNTLEQMGFNSATDDVEVLLANKVHRNTTAFRFAKRRLGASDLELDAFNVFSKYQEKAIDHIKLTPAIGKVRELTRTKIFDPTTQKAFLLRDTAPQVFKETQQWLDYVAGQKPDVHLPKVVETVLSKLNQNIAFATLSYNIRSAVIQPSAIINTITELGVKNTIRGIKELMLGGGDIALKKSNVLEGRQFETAIKEMASNTFGKAKRTTQKIAEVGVKPLQFLDSLTAQATWLGAYNRATTELGMVGEKAINYADDVVTKTQASAARSDVAKIQRTVTGKIITQFQTFVINDFNRILKDVLGIGTNIPNSVRIKKAATYLVAVTLWNYISEDVLGVPSPFPRPIKALKERGIIEAGKEMSSQIPIVGGSLRYGSSFLGAAGELGNQIMAKVNGKYTPQSWWEIAGKVFGVPATTQLKKTITAVKGLDDGYTVTTNKGKKIKIKITDPVDQVRSLLFGLYESNTAKDVRETGKRPLKLNNPNRNQ